MKDIIIKAKENLATRKYNTEKARELIYEILDGLSKLLDDEDRYLVKSISFAMKAKFEDDDGYYVNYIATHKGFVEIISEDWNEKEEIVTRDEIAYVNFIQLVKALEDFIEKLSKMTIYESEKEKLEEVLSILEGEND